MLQCDTVVHFSAALMSVRREGVKSEGGDSEDEDEHWDEEAEKVCCTLFHSLKFACSF